MRSATSSRHGAAITCTPIGNGESGTGTVDDRHADEGDRLRVNAEIGAHRHFDAVEHERLLPDQRRRARRRRRQNGVDLGKQLQHLALIPAAEFLRLDDQRGRQHGARDQPVAHGRVEILRTGAQPLEVQACRPRSR